MYLNHFAGIFFVKKIGEKNVVQVVTNSESKYVIAENKHENCLWMPTQSVYASLSGS